MPAQSVPEPPESADPASFVPGFGRDEGALGTARRVTLGPGSRYLLPRG